MCRMLAEWFWFKTGLILSFLEIIERVESVLGIPPVHNTTYITGHLCPLKWPDITRTAWPYMVKCCELTVTGGFPQTKRYDQVRKIGTSHLQIIHLSCTKIVEIGWQFGVPLPVYRTIAGSLFIDIICLRGMSASVFDWATKYQKTIFQLLCASVSERVPSCAKIFYENISLICMKKNL